MHLKKNRRVIGIIVFLLFLSGCTKFQYISVSGDTKSIDRNELIFETDSLLINYSFTGDGGLITIKIFNKLDNPTFVDWSKSSLIINENSFSYWSDQSHINTNNINQGSIFAPNLVVGNTNGTIVKPEKISSIPPQSSITFSPTSLKETFFNTETIPYQSQNNGDIAGYKAKYYHYQLFNTPLKFRSFISISSSQDFKDPFYIDHHFWVSEIINTKAEPAWVVKGNKNQFYISKTTGLGKGMMGVGLGIVFYSFMALNNIL